MLIPYRRRLIIRRLALFIPLLVMVLVLPFFLLDNSSPPPADQSATPKEVVEQFYEYEQEGEFEKSWELFHSQMRQMFSKEDYVQRRSDGLMRVFGVKTFHFTIGEPTVVTSWRMSPGSPALPEVIRVPAEVFYESSFGDLMVKQDVFLAKENGQYKVLWQFSRDD